MGRNKTMYRVLMNGEEIAGRVEIANTFFSRLKGLLHRKGLDEEEGLLIRPCNQVHTFGMKFDIDVVFLSGSGDVLHIQPNMAPGAVSPFIHKCHQVLELKSGIIEDRKIIAGKNLAFDPVNN